MSVALPSRILNHLSLAVPAQSLALFRIIFGALLLWDCWRFIKYDRIWRYWVAPDFHFSYPGFSWVEPLPEPWIQIAWLGLGVAALLVMLGLFYRFAIIALTLLFGYFFLLDSAEYLNHFYLVLLYALLLCCLPAARVWSLDALIRPRRETSVPYAAVFMLRAQTEIVLIYAGLVKLTPDWLRGEPLGLWLRERTHGLWIEPVFQQDWLIVLACWSVIALHVLGAPLLLKRKTRLPVFLIYGLFHFANAFFFNIGIFPWLTIAATTIFFAPDWPVRMISRLRKKGTVSRMPQTTPPAKALPRFVLLASAVWLAGQLVIPIRGGAFESEIRWSGDGHRFSWRMRLFDREAVGMFVVTDRDSGDSWRVDPDDYLTFRQTDKMLVRADMIHQFANHLADLWQQEGQDVSVHAEICKSLNGRPCQIFIDPDADLTRVEWNLLSTEPWVLPLEKQAWGIADNRKRQEVIIGQNM